MSLEASQPDSKSATNPSSKPANSPLVSANTNIRLLAILMSLTIITYHGYYAAHGYYVHGYYAHGYYAHDYIYGY